MVPQLRPDVQSFVDPRGLIVHDPHTGLRVLLGPESTVLWNAMSGGVASEGALRHATPSLSDAQRFVRLMQLDQALLLASPRWRRQEHLFHARAKSVDAPLYVHPLLTHQCVRCGSSCQEVHVGPISPLTAAAIRTHELWRGDPQATRAEDIWVEADLGGAKGALMLQQVEGRCVVWDREKGCTIQAAAGHKLKPVPCAQYPYTLTRTSKGVYVGLQVSCRSLPQSLKEGSSLRPTEVAQMLAPIVMSGGQTQTLPAPAPLSAGSYIPDTAIEEWWRWAVKSVERALGELEQRAREYMDERHWRPALRALNDYVHEWLLRVDESDAGEEWLEHERWLSQSLLPTRQEVRSSFVDELQLSLQEAAALHQREGRWQEMKRIERLYDAVEVWAGRWPLPEARWRGHGGDRLLLLTLLEAVYSHRLFLLGDLVYGLAYLRLHLELTESLARLSAHLSGRAYVEESEVNDAVALVYRALREPAVDGALKRWAGGLRWLMSPDGVPYRHGFGTLEPHLFKHPSHLMHRQLIERAQQVERASAEQAVAITSVRLGERGVTPTPAVIKAADLERAQEGDEGGGEALPVGGDFEGVSVLSAHDPALINASASTPKSSPADPYPNARPAPSGVGASPPSRLRRPASPLAPAGAARPASGLSSPYDQAAGQRTAEQRARVAASLKGLSPSKPEDDQDP